MAEYVVGLSWPENAALGAVISGFLQHEFGATDLELGEQVSASRQRLVVWILVRCRQTGLRSSTFLTTDLAMQIGNLKIDQRRRDLVSSILIAWSLSSLLVYCNHVSICIFHQSFTTLTTKCGVGTVR